MLIRMLGRLGGGGDCRIRAMYIEGGAWRALVNDAAVSLFV